MKALLWFVGVFVNLECLMTSWHFGSAWRWVWLTLAVFWFFVGVGLAATWLAKLATGKLRMAPARPGQAGAAHGATAKTEE